MFPEFKVGRKIGIVGSEGAKFTPQTEYKAKGIIKGLLSSYDTVVSGGCHLGGIDIWAEEIADLFDLPKSIYVPRALSWSYGYKPRNLAIARESDIVYCITIKELPPNYQGMRFDYCYHCGTNEHVKSGGCWTVKQARLMGKPGEVIVI